MSLGIVGNMKKADIEHGYEEASKLINERRDEMIRLLTEAISIPTENPPGKNYPEFVDFLARYLRQRGYEIEIIRIPNESLDELAPHGEGLPRTNLIARSQFGANKPVLHLNGHFDVVPAGEGWTMDPFKGVVKEGRIYGRGSTDMKSGIIAQIFAIDALREVGCKVNGRIVQSFTCDEESGGFAGVGYLVRNSYISSVNTDYVLFTEPTDLKYLINGHRGLIWFEIVTYGRKAHGGTASLGVNALDHMVFILHKMISKLRPKVESRVSDLPTCPAEASSSTITPTTINAGTALNVVPDRCIVKFDRRISPTEKVHEAYGEIQEFLADLKQERPSIDYRVRQIMSVEAISVPTDTPLFNSLKDAAQLVLGYSPELRLMSATFDMKFIVGEAGIKQCTSFGPGLLSVEHTSDEYVMIDDVVRAAKVYVMAILRLLGLKD